jgi:hypothetical protein
VDLSYDRLLMMMMTSLLQVTINPKFRAGLVRGIRKSFYGRWLISMLEKCQTRGPVGFHGVPKKNIYLMGYWL